MRSPSLLLIASSRLVGGRGCSWSLIERCGSLGLSIGERGHQFFFFRSLLYPIVIVIVNVRASLALFFRVLFILSLRHSIVDVRF